ncbi:MAG: ATP synthase F1 subunit epsilon [Candidatus Saccharibacteria bacterium]|nr:ATP synthase F1 subunit epsilon [Candidatus Saccharibacteria bacterium]
MQLKLVTLLGEKLSEPVYELVLPSKSGRITVLPGHEPLVTLLNPGAMAIRRRKDDPDLKLEFLAVSGGVAKITQDEVVILADEAESDREIAEKEAKVAYERAVKAAENVTDQIELEEAKRLVQHQAARLRVAELRRRHREMK